MEEDEHGGIFARAHAIAHKNLPAVAVAAFVVWLLAEGVFNSNRLYEEAKDFLEHHANDAVAVAILFALAILVAELWTRAATARIARSAAAGSGLDRQVHVLADQIETLTREVGALRAGFQPAIDAAGGFGTQIATLQGLRSAIEGDARKVREFTEMMPPVAGEERVRLLKTQLMMLPEHYRDKLRRLRDAKALETKSLVMVGSMVGFTLTAPEELAYLVSPASKRLEEIIIIGPNVAASQDGRPSNLAFPVFNFQLRFLYLLLLNMSWSDLQRDWRFDLSCFYVPFDALGAAILVPGQYAIALQALSPDALVRVTQNDGHIVGMLYDAAGPSEAVYRRLEEAMTAYQSHRGKCSDPITFRSHGGKLTITTSGLVMPRPDYGPVLNPEIAERIERCDSGFAPASFVMTKDTFEPMREALLGRLRDGIEKMNKIPSTSKINSCVPPLWNDA